MGGEPSRVSSPGSGIPVLDGGVARLVDGVAEEVIALRLLYPSRTNHLRTEFCMFWRNRRLRSSPARKQPTPKKILNTFRGSGRWIGGKRVLPQN